MIRIVIADDQEMLLGTIGSLLNMEVDMEVVGLASTGEEAIELVNRLQPDVCLMDIEMPEKNGLEGAEALKTNECKVIIFTSFARTSYFRCAVKAGVSGYLLKDDTSEELARSIRCIMNGMRIYSPELMDSDSCVVSDANQNIYNPTNKRKNTFGTVKNYFSTIIDKMKLPTG